MNIVVFYDKFSTFTNTVFDHLRSFSMFSDADIFYCHGGHGVTTRSISEFDVAVIHYSLRIPLGRVEGQIRNALKNFRGLKILFVQDEYDLAESVRKAISELDIRLVFTCVPEEHVDKIYPKTRFPDTCFVANLTGYLPLDKDFSIPRRPIKDRPTVVGYRGRALPYWYGDLGQEKQTIAQVVRQECNRRQVACDIEWTDQNRIYGEKWNEFLSSCKVTLGTESGSNIFDDHGDIRKKISSVLARNPSASYGDVRHEVFGDGPEQTIMNQVSPRIFEAIAAGTGLVLYEGYYSGVVEPYSHYIPLRKDHGNMEEVFELLNDDEGLQAMADRAFEAVIGSGAYSYENFIKTFDLQVARFVGEVSRAKQPQDLGGIYTAVPIRTQGTQVRHLLVKAWAAVPESIRTKFRPVARRVWEWTSR